MLPGVGSQNLTTEYIAMRGKALPGDKLQGHDATITHVHGYRLPMVHARYRPLDWLQIHLCLHQYVELPGLLLLTWGDFQ